MPGRSRDLENGAPRVVREAREILATPSFL